MTLQELRYLVAVADRGHFGRAAASCAVSQPTLSAGVKKLEDELGVALFERSRRSVAPTAAGEALAAQARVVLAEAERLRELAEGSRGPLVGAFALGAIPTVGPYLFPHVVQGLREAFPELRLRLHEARTEPLLEGLRAGRLDAALLSPPVPGEDLESADLYAEPFLLAVPAGHRLARRRRIRPADLQDEEILLLEEGHCMRGQALEVCGRLPTAAREAFAGASLETLRNMVAAGAGCTLVPALAAAGDARRPAGLEIRPFARPAPTRTVSLYWRARFARRESALALAGLLRGQLPRAVEPCSA